MQVTTLGRELIRQKLPDKYKQYADRVLDKKTTSELMTAIAKEDPDGYLDVLQDLNNIGQAITSTYGRDAALSFSDLKIDTPTRNINQQLRAIVDKVLNDDSLSDKQKEEKIKELGYKYTKKVEDAVFEANDRRGTALASQINSGSRGNKTQLRQLQFGNILMKDALNRDIPYLMLDPYMRGTTPMGYWVSASSGRKGFYDVQAATGQAGYMGKRVTAATHDTIISKDDCGTTDTGVPFPANSDKNIGAVLLRPFHKYPAGTIVTDKMVAEADDDEEMILRSPTTCKCKIGVCAKCNGLGENGKFPGIGEYVALNAARAFVEPITQGGISCLHPDTLVRMADWSVKAIKDIIPGDMVIGVSITGKLKETPVLHVFDNGLMPMLRTVFDNGKELISTETHKVLKYYSNENKIEPIDKLENTEVPCVFVNSDVVEHVDVIATKPYGFEQALDIEVKYRTHLFLLANGLVVSNSKHAGGVGGKKVIDPEGEDQPTGFRSIERFIMTPSNFAGKAILAPADGVVQSVQKAPQGGTYITVGENKLYCSPERTIQVKPGDKVYAGDTLTNGVPNPMELVALKGLGEGRRYFTNKFTDILKKNGFAIDRRNIESFSRAMVSRVEITDPDGFGTHLPGDLVDYNEIAADYTPRDDAKEEPVDKAVNKYLEKPVLYYTIGTRITPTVAKELKKYKFDNVTVSDKEPPFKPQYIRPASILENNKNWMPRLAGERLKYGLFAAAREGVTDAYNSPSYVNKIVAAPFQP